MRITKKQALAMQGTEFIYTFQSGRTMKAYIKKFDLETGRMSCWSFSLTTDCGTKTFRPLNLEEKKEGACCVIATRNWKSTQGYLKQIVTGVFVPDERSEGGFKGCIF